MTSDAIILRKHASEITWLRRRLLRKSFHWSLTSRLLRSLSRMVIDWPSPPEPLRRGPPALQRPIHPVGLAIQAPPPFHDLTGFSVKVFGASQHAKRKSKAHLSVCAEAARSPVSSASPNSANLCSAPLKSSLRREKGGSDPTDLFPLDEEVVLG